ncbi:MAG: malectin domain-containing carbohydrate-binding protein, partial [bacterium]
SVTAGDGAAADQYSTNVNTLSTLYNYLLTNWGPAGKNNMWFASAGRVQDYLFTRDNAVVSTCTSSGSPTDTPLPSPSFSPSPSFTHSPTSTVSPTPRPTPDACQDVVAVNCGGAAYTSSSLGLTFAADQQYVPGSAPGAAGSYGYLAADAGTAYATTNTFTGSDAADATLYNSQYYGATVAYDFSVPNGPAYVTFYWAETYATAIGQRVFSVTINGTTVEPNLDLYAVSGGENVTYSATFPVTVANGVINIVATASANSAEFQAISVQAGAPCTASPTHSPTWSITPTSTHTVSSSPTATDTALPSASVTASKTPSGTLTSTVTLSDSPTLQSSVTSSFTATKTVTPDPT